MKQKNVILMVVAVGCGLVAAFLTSQMSAKPQQVEKVRVLVAAKDLTVGTQLTKDDLATAVKWKELPKDVVPQNIIETEEELIDKRLTRTLRVDEIFQKPDLTKYGVVSIPPGMNMVALPIDAKQAVAGFILPGSRVDVLASVRLSNNLRALPILVNMLVLAVDTNPNAPKEGVHASLSTVSFAVDRKQALLIKLAQARGCDISLLLRNPEDKDNELDRNYKIEDVIKLLQDDHSKTDLKDPNAGTKNPAESEAAPETRPSVPAPQPTVKRETVTVPYALVDVKEGTEITEDLIADATVFGSREVPKELAEDAVTDLSPFLGKVFKNGLGKGQWVTKGLVGKAEPKPAPRSEFNEPKPAPQGDQPLPRPVAVRKTHDVTMHTASGTKVYRYEEVAPGEWKFAGEVNPNAPPRRAPAAPTPEQVD